MKAINMIAIAAVAVITAIAPFSAFAEQTDKALPAANQQQTTPATVGQTPTQPVDQPDSGKQSSTTMGSNQGGMPMMPNDQSGMPMMMGNNQGGMPMMEMMKQQQAGMQEHMQKMEMHMANIEALLKELVQLQKSK